jgi:hypothetical protein
MVPYLVRKSELNNFFRLIQQVNLFKIKKLNEKIYCKYSASIFYINNLIF